MAIVSLSSVCMVQEAMTSISALVLLYIFLIAECLGARQCPPQPSAPRALDRLKETLFCDYSKDSLPVKNINNTVKLDLTFTLDSIETADNTFSTVSGVLGHTWSDEFLRWDPAEYDEIHYFKADDQIWTPELLTNSLSTVRMEKLKPDNCIVFKYGGVNCLPLVSLEVPCEMNSRHWPFEEHNCTMSVSPWLNLDHQILISSLKVYTYNYQSGKEWKLLNVSTNRHTQLDFENSTYSIYSTSFVFKRINSAYAAMTIIPTVVLMVVTMSTFWMGRRLTARVTVCGFAAFTSSSQATFLLYLIPSNGDETPVIFILLRDGLTLAGLGIVVAIIVCLLSVTDSQPPKWLSDITDKIELSFAASLLCLETPVATKTDDEEGVVDQKEKLGPWYTITVILDRSAFIVCLVVNFVLVTGYIP